MPVINRLPVHLLHWQRAPRLDRHGRLVSPNDGLFYVLDADPRTTCGVIVRSAFSRIFGRGWLALLRAARVYDYLPNGQFTNLLQKEKCVYNIASPKEEESRNGKFRCSGCAVLKGEISELREYIRRHVESAGCVSGAVPVNQAVVGCGVSNSGNSSCVGRHGGDVEHGDVDSSRTALGTTDSVLPLERNRGNTYSRSHFHCKFADTYPRKISVRQKSCCNTESGGKGHQPSSVLREVTDVGGGERADSAYDAVDSGDASSTVESPSGRRKTYCSALLEGGQPMGRNLRINKGQVSRIDADKDCDMVGTPNEDVSVQSVPPVYVYCSRRTGDRSTGGIRIKPREVSADVSRISLKRGSENPPHTRGGVRNSFSKTWSDNPALCRGGQRECSARGRSEVSKTPITRVPAKIQCGSSDYSLSAWYPKSDVQATDIMSPEDVFRKFLEEFPHEKVRHTITRTRRTSKVASPKDFNIPLHIKKGIPRMQVHSVRNMMNETTQERFDETWATLLRLPEQPSRVPVYRSFLPQSDVKQLIDAGFVTKVSDMAKRDRPTMDWVLPFTVIEPTEDGTGERRRFIAWTKQDNDRIKGEYDPYVPVKHAAYYLHRAKEESAVNRDLACGFWQVEIPVESRQKFRFTDQN